jgi:hypothetical protein
MLDPAAECGFEALRSRALHRSKGIRRIRVQRIAVDNRRTEVGRELSPAAYTRKELEIQPEMRVWLKSKRQIIEFKDSVAEREGFELAMLS